MIPTCWASSCWSSSCSTGSAAIRPIVLAGKISNPEQIANIRAQLGIDQPYHVQLWIFVKQIVTFDFGARWSTSEQVSNILATPPRPVADGAGAAD